MSQGIHTHPYTHLRAKQCLPCLTYSNTVDFLKFFLHNLYGLGTYGIKTGEQSGSHHNHGTVFSRASAHLRVSARLHFLAVNFKRTAGEECGITVLSMWKATYSYCHRKSDGCNMWFQFSVLGSTCLKVNWLCKRCYWRTMQQQSHQHSISSPSPPPSIYIYIYIYI